MSKNFQFNIPGMLNNVLFINIWGYNHISAPFIYLYVLCITNNPSIFLIELQWPFWLSPAKTYAHSTTGNTKDWTTSHYKVFHYILFVQNIGDKRLNRVIYSNFNFFITFTFVQKIGITLVMAGSRTCQPLTGGSDGPPTP